MLKVPTFNLWFIFSFELPIDNLEHKSMMSGVGFIIYSEYHTMYIVSGMAGNFWLREWFIHNSKFHIVSSQQTRCDKLMIST